MQKFKVKKSEIANAVFPVSRQDWLKEPDYLILEGELLEGGTLETCCEHFPGSRKEWLCACPCHHKKVGLEGLLCDVNECRCGTCHKEEKCCPPCCGAFQGFDKKPGKCLKPDCWCHNKKEVCTQCATNEYNGCTGIICTKSCPCKKEEKTACAHCLESKGHLEGCKYFNRETPKKCPTCGHSKEMGTVARCTSEFHKEEVQLPEKLIWDKQTANAKEIYWTVNAILDYLKAHE